MSKFFLSMIIACLLCSCGTAHLLPKNLSLEPDQPPIQWSLIDSPYTLEMAVLSENNNTSHLRMTTRSRGFKYPLLHLIVSTETAEDEFTLLLAYLSVDDILINQTFDRLPLQQDRVKLSLTTKEGEFEITANGKSLSGTLKNPPAIAQLRSSSGKSQVVILSQGNKED